MIKKAIISISIFVAGLFGLGDYGIGAVSFPSSLDTLTNPTATTRTNVVSHAGQHSDANDAIEALQAKVGVDGSAVNTSFDFKLSGVADGDYACSLDGTEILTNKTLTTPKISNLFDINGISWLSSLASTSAVNSLLISNAATGFSPFITATGTDSNISMWLYGKGTGQVLLGDAKLKWPDSDGSANYVLKTDGARTLSWGSSSGFAFDNGTGSFDGTSNATTTISHGLGVTPVFVRVNAWGADVSGAGGDGGNSLGTYHLSGSTYATLYIKSVDTATDPDGDIGVDSTSIMHIQTDLGTVKATVVNAGSSSFDLVITGTGDANTGNVYYTWEAEG